MTGPSFVEEWSALQWNRLRITGKYTAFSVREATAFLSKTTADIVRCDIEMPGGNGLQLLKWIREKTTRQWNASSFRATRSFMLKAHCGSASATTIKPRIWKRRFPGRRTSGCGAAGRRTAGSLWAALFDGAVTQARFHQPGAKARPAENSNLALLLLRFVPVPGEVPLRGPEAGRWSRSRPFRPGRPERPQTVVRLVRPGGFLVCHAEEKDPFPPRATGIISRRRGNAGSAFRSAHTAAKKAPSGTRYASSGKALRQLENHAVPDMQRIAQEADLPADKIQRRPFPLKAWKKMLVGLAPSQAWTRPFVKRWSRSKRKGAGPVNRLTVLCGGPSR